MLIVPTSTSGAKQFNTTRLTGVSIPPDCLTSTREIHIEEMAISPLDDQGLTPRTLQLSLEQDGSYQLNASLGQVSYRGTVSHTETITASGSDICRGISSTFSNIQSGQGVEHFPGLLPTVNGQISGGLIQGSNTVTIPVPPSTIAGDTQSGASTATMTWSLRPR